MKRTKNEVLDCSRVAGVSVEDRRGVHYRTAALLPLLRLMAMN